MAITTNAADNEKYKFKEATSVADQPGVVVINPDGSNVGTGTGATALGKAEDAAHTSGDTGVMLLAVRKATPANLSGTDGDYEPLQMSGGYLWVKEGYAPVYEDNTNGKAVVEHRYTATRITADAQVKATAGFIHTVTIAPSGTVTAGVLTIYDSAAESGTVLLAISLPITTFSPFTVILNVSTTTGIYVGFDGTLANVNALVSWR